ncbi:hypothetical protein GCM10022419_087190 [Nonomuraea rosea]|uniref:Uncharacterized protein n=1 Tax=Nonomuraea rosea TaxID=638574 RepID=A0ABP6YUB9_9ACTN
MSDALLARDLVRTLGTGRVLDGTDTVAGVLDDAHELALGAEPPRPPRKGRTSGFRNHGLTSGI